MEVTREISVAAHAVLALEFLAQSDDDFDTGKLLDASECLYNAAWQALVALARQHEWAYASRRDLYAVRKQLWEEYGDPYLSAGFVAADMFHSYFVHNGDGMEDYEIEINRLQVHRYVRRLIALVKKNGTNRP